MLLVRTVSIIWLTVFMSANAQRLSLSTASDSAVYYYYEGWRQVLDEGHYTASEKFYRKMMKNDPGFLVGLSLVGRITRDLDERLDIEEQLEKRKGEITGDERLLLDNFIDLVKLTNLRETRPEDARRFMDQVFISAEKTLRKISHTYPDEIHYRSEYIEVLRRNHGARVALDSLLLLTSPKEQQTPFLLGYSAQMLAEIGDFESALAKADRLNQLFKNEDSPKPHAVLADIYFRMGELDKAAMETERALQLDPGNIDCQRLRKQMEKARKEKQ